MSSPETQTSPTKLLRRYGENVFPPKLTPDQNKILVDHLRDQGMTAKVGTVAIGPKLTTEKLVALAVQDLHPSDGLSNGDIVVGPNSVGMLYGISLWLPSAPPEVTESL